MTQAHATPEMKQFRLPDGQQVWNSPHSGGDIRFLYRETFERRCYEQNGITIRNGDVVFDVGANIGMFDLSLMSRFRDLRIFSFEPVPGTYACLARNVGGDGSHQVVPFNIGLGAAETQTTIEFFPGAPSNSTMYSAEKHRDFSRILDGVRWTDLWRTRGLGALLLLPLFPFRKRLLGPALDGIVAKGVQFPCQVRRLSSIIREHSVPQIDLLKVDVEGAEMDVLTGIDEDHWPLIRQLCMEIEVANKPRVPALLERLQSLGFTGITLQSMFGGRANLTDSVPCTVYAVR